MNYKKRRDEVLSKMEKNSVLVLYSGVRHHVSADEYAPFEANRNFFYLTGIRRENMMLILDNATEEPTETLLIEEADPDRERWMGKKMTVYEAKAQAQGWLYRQRERYHQPYADKRGCLYRIF